MNLYQIIITLASLVLLATSSYISTYGLNQCECDNLSIFVPNQVVMVMSIISLILMYCNCGFVEAGHALTTIAPGVIVSVSSLIMTLNYKKCKKCQDGDKKRDWKSCCTKNNIAVLIQLVVSVAVLVLGLVANANFRAGVYTGISTTAGAAFAGVRGVGRGAKAAVKYGKKSYKNYKRNQQSKKVNKVIQDQENLLRQLQARKAQLDAAHERDLEERLLRL